MICVYQTEMFDNQIKGKEDHRYSQCLPCLNAITRNTNMVT
ncbi:hypothetical protein SLEP1_g4786 [Rubroshorea leprosula]|uniref:Uncharacterized protein n=1 Tax=Rubroshorea leprosula TaxID=152421 RepID=A0AAV5HYS0_9ROSI|nr:hypothetical protein SLEP1_g4786 [Rubroshorea leprosula]